MINIKQLREFPEQAKQAIHKKDPEFDVDRLVTLDNHVRQLRQEVESLRARKNELVRQGKAALTEEVREEAVALSRDIKDKQQRLDDAYNEFRDLCLRCPNFIADDIPEGDESNNTVVSYHNEKPEFSFEPDSHVNLLEALDWCDFKAGTQISGAGFVVYKNEGARLLYALTSYMLSHNASYGFEQVFPPFLVNAQSLEGSGNLPRFEEDVYKVADHDLYLTPTAEVNLTNLHRNARFEADHLPCRMTAWTSCFRQEAGSYGSQERGLIRLHQFEKVEIYSVVAPDQAEEEQNYMITCVTDLLDALQLHYRVVLLAAQDTSFASAKTYDIEVWLPGQKEYREVSSISNCTDFQARRCNIKYRKAQHEKPELAYTLNGSSLALPRLLVAIVETYQQEDGSVVLPETLRNLVRM